MRWARWWLTHSRGGEVIGLNPNIRVYRYSKSQFFDCHCISPPFLLSLTFSHPLSIRVPSHSPTNTPPDDDSNNVTLHHPAKTTWTLLLYLTSSSPSPSDGECAGGETVFYPRGRRTERDALTFAPEAGTVLLHKHGDECMLVSQPKFPVPQSLSVFSCR